VSKTELSSHDKSVPKIAASLDRCQSGLIRCRATSPDARHDWQRRAPGNWLAKLGCLIEPADGLSPPVQRYWQQCVDIRRQAMHLGRKQFTKRSGIVQLAAELERFKTGIDGKFVQQRSNRRLK
jgi:hypothetical protein